MWPKLPEAKKPISEERTYRPYPSDADGWPEDNFRVANHPPGISVSLQVEDKQFVGSGHLIGSSLR